MHFLEWVLLQLGHIITAVKFIFRVLRAIRGAIKYQLRTSSEDAAKSAPTASVIRGSRTRLRWFQRFGARQLEREGHGVIRDGYYENWVNVTPSGIVMAIQMRERFSPRHHHDDWRQRFNR